MLTTLFKTQSNQRWRTACHAFVNTVSQLFRLKRHPGEGSVRIATTFRSFYFPPFFEPANRAFRLLRLRARPGPLFTCLGK